ncbi:hypothetical protein JCM10213_009329 [Rhodosporidiobolus nylandii]
MLDLRQWLTGEGVHLSDALQLARRDDGSCAVDCVAPIVAGETVARIPKHLVLSPLTSSLAPFVPPEYAAALAAALVPLRLAVHVAHELLLGERSRWATFFRYCPPPAKEGETTTVGAIWDEGGDERRWVKGAEVERELQKAEISKAALHTFSHTLALPLLHSVSSHFTYTSQPTISTLERASYLILTRAFHVDHTFHRLSLVPLACLFNHETDSAHNVHFASEQWVCSECGAEDECEHDNSATPPPLSGRRKGKEEEETCDMVATRPIAPGEEAFNSYGPALGNAKLLAQYGFLLEANEHDLVSFLPSDLFAVAELGVSAAAEVEIEARWRKLLTEEGELVEPDHPLLAELDEGDDPASSSAAASALHVDADARLSLALWALLVVLSCPPSSPAPSPADLQRLASSLQALAEAEEVEVDMPQEDVQTLRRIGELVGRLVRRRIAAQAQPEASAVELLDLAEKTRPPSVRLAIEYTAGERLLLERVEGNWKDLFP